MSSGGSTGSSTESTTMTGTDTGTVCMNGDQEKEPNDSEADAQNLGTISDADATGDSISGVIAGAGDADWFKYLGQDEFGVQVVDPARELMSNGFQLRICKFIQCSEDGAAPDFGACPDGTSAEVSPGGRPGCCGTAGFSLDLDCGGAFETNDSATVYVRIDSPAGEDCAPYTMSYHY